jgi:hypothetical protein
MSTADAAVRKAPARVGCLARVGAVDAGIREGSSAEAPVMVAAWRVFF